MAVKDMKTLTFNTQEYEIIDDKARKDIAPAYDSTKTYVKGEYCMKSGQLKKCKTAITTAEEWNAAHWEDATVGEIVSELESNTAELGEEKANIDGYYENLGAGIAEQLVSSVYDEDKVPYNFRTSGGSANIGDREDDMLVGGTVAWNQKVTSVRATTTTLGLTLTNHYPELVMTGEATQTDDFTIASAYIPANHVGAWFCGVPRTENYGLKVNYTLPAIGHDGVITKSSGNLSNMLVRVNAGVDVGTVTFKPVVFDLTQMFGSTIADYIYSLEQTTAGAGVAWFRNLFPKPYYAYNAGELMSVRAARHRTVGFNQWDEEWEVGKYNASTGIKTGNTSSTPNVRSKNYIPVIGGQNYYLRSNNSAFVFCYDDRKNYLGQAVRVNDTTSTQLRNQNFQLKPGTCFITFYVSNIETYDYSVCINLMGDGGRNGAYEPYKLKSYELDSALTLRGIPKLDADNRLYYDGDTYESDGTVTRKYGVVDLGTLTWSKGEISQGTMFRASVSGIKQTYNSLNLICGKYITKTSDGRTNESISKTSGEYVDIIDSSYSDSDADAFKAAMSGVYLVYELAAPAAEEVEPYHNPQIVAPDGTEEYVDAAVEAGTRDVAIPVGHVTRYPADQVAKLDGLPSDFSTLIAPVEKTYKATQNYAQGAYLIVSNILYKVTSAIASGGTITPGTNVTATTLTAELLAVNT